jgi:aspartyl protease family protein
MPRDEGPWASRPPQPQSPIRLFIWLALLALIAIAIWKLSELFPGSAHSDWDRARIVQLIFILALVSSGIVFSRRYKLRETARNIAIWMGIASVLATGFTFQDELRTAYERVRAELIPSYAVMADPKTLVLTQSENGHYYLTSELNGVPVTFLVDTGASDVVLSPSDAKRLGVDVGHLEFNHVYETANGIGRGASYRVARMMLGKIELDDVPVSINAAYMTESLLGMSVLRNIASVEIRDRKLYLRWR